MPKFRDTLAGWQQKEFDTLGPKDKRRFMTANKRQKGEGRLTMSPKNFRTNDSGFYSPSRSGGTE